jgi:hypothetical protein
VVDQDDPRHLRWAQEVITQHEARVQEAGARWDRTMAMPVFQSAASTRAALVMSAVGFDWRT